jgi:3-hydroxyacyl-CoA dehydrogenase/enoyl-CoA hydratase/3-hydroxybutyryl-CoA epimerase
VTASEIIRWSQDADGIVVLTLDDPDRSVNTMNVDFVNSLETVIGRLEAERETVTGVVIASGKRTFFAGGDLQEMIAVRPEDAAAYSAGIRRTNLLLQRLESLGRPVVAAIGGAALGGGLELTLACHRRIVVDDDRIPLGTPEVTLGLLPGGGGIVRGVRMLGVKTALKELLVEGRSLTPAKALKLGLVDQLVDSKDELIAAAKTWIGGGPEPVQPWQVEGYEIPGGTPSDPSFASVVQTLPSQLRRQVKGANYPAPTHIIAAAVEGSQVDFDSALEIERRYFISLVTGQVAKNMIQAFFDLRRVRRDRGLVADAEPFAPRKAVILGAGMMGGGIAYVCAKAGIEVVLIDLDLAAARRGKDYSEKIVTKETARGSIGADEARALLDRITPSAEHEDAAGADLMIEAVFEDSQIKGEVYAKVEPYLSDDALLASNTSTLPVSELAESITRPSDFLGLHFFSPVDKMQLLEIVVGERSAAPTVQRGLDLAHALGKTPIVVNDSRGFFTSRVITCFHDEGIAMLDEGIPASSIEQASSQAGYPAPVLQLADELNLNLIRMIREEARAASEADGRGRITHPADPVIDRMLDEFGRGGRLAGAGFYDYEDGRRTGLWSGLDAAFQARLDDLPPFIDLQERMLFSEALEAVRCLEEGVIDSVADGNVGSILGIGFPRWTGGVFQYINGFAGGLPGFVVRAQVLADLYGSRFAPPAALIERSEKGETFLGKTEVVL